MERPLTLKPLSIQDENSAIVRKKPAVEGKAKSFGPAAKKGAVAPESRKALNDITNKKPFHPAASSQKKGSQSKKLNIAGEGYKHHGVFDAEALSQRKGSLFEKLNIAEEGFLHDHSKCVQAQKSARELNFWDIVLPGHDAADVMVKKEEHKPEASRKLDELPMTEFLGSKYKSPPGSPPASSSPFVPWDLEPVELVLKEDNLVLDA
ncbi:protein PATRONUS 2-like [Andrographis paniculata]|uniref:protein PATRONUS 2-like n=1 Tax=Andrographis paniculata TaxID=175694 RepID=UPI0021E8F21E|nr:protein PATRONUS 2-like [Andrographis paniculata]